MSAHSVIDPNPAPPPVYRSQSFTAVMRALTDALDGDERIAVVTGECGVGKTTLLGVFREQIPSHWAVIEPAPWKSDPDGLLPWLLHTLDAPTGNGMAPTSALHAAATRLQATATALLIDEAQALKGKALAQLAALLRWTPEDSLRLFLFGQPGLAVNLRRKSGSPLAKLPHRRHVLRPLARADVGSYVRFRSRTGGPPWLEFTDEALDLVCVASRGSPRLINRLCDTTADICERSGVSTVDVELVRQAVRLANGLDIFESCETAIPAAGATAVSSPDAEAPAAPRPARAARLRGPPLAAPHAQAAARSPAKAARPRGDPPARPRPDLPKPAIRFLEETPPGSAVSGAELIVHEEPEPFCRGGGSDPRAMKPSPRSAFGGSPGAPLPDPDLLIKMRLLNLGSICVILAAAGLFLQPFLDSEHPDLPADTVAPGDAQGTRGPQAAPLPAPRPDRDQFRMLAALLENLPSLPRPDVLEKDVEPRVFGPSKEKRPLSLEEVLELWRPHVEPER